MDIQADLHPICPLKPLRARNMIRAYSDNWKPVIDKFRLKVRICFFVFCFVFCFAQLVSPSGSEMRTNQEIKGPRRVILLQTAVPLKQQ